MNQLIIISGLSGTEKSTLAKAISKQENAEIIALGDFLREVAKQEGLELRAYFKKYGWAKGFELARAPVIKKIESALEKGNVILEGLYDNQVYQELIKRHDRKNIFVIGMAASRHAIKRRMQIRHKMTVDKIVPKIRTRDRIKKLAGLQTIQRDANLIIRANSKLDVLKKYAMHMKL